jgi:LysM repeat protein
MKKLFILLFIIAPAFAFAMPTDSIGVKTEGGVVYILHKVDRGETLFGIARKYGVSVNEITAANPGLEKGLRADATIKIPSKNNTVLETIVEQPAEIVEANPRSTIKTNGTTPMHTVEAGETLYKLSVKYGVSVEDIKKWNALQSESLSIGQQLVVGKQSNVTTIPKTREPQKTTNPVAEPTTVQAPKATTSDQGTNSRVTNADVINTKVEGNPSEEESGVTIPARQVRTIGDEIVETGSVTVSETGELAQDRNFILHPSAKIGTVVMITNVSNGKSSFARVVGNYKAPADQVATVNQTLVAKLGINTASHQIKINYAR